ncbi:DUF1223 domain-containing protein [Ancylobacter mangrovi]|uniref:DUF1223 domain-containing protein n=1 Tax=Ancylobacter mangrovi TaxID=2972472 RepID=UPI00216236DF|nr:DUF1223 domain-containing protein [Ancylobacter mangrovi]MCS0502550.1 DUF1223 domain-containing protein [Ancylobacter mangrovi]
MAGGLLLSALVAAPQARAGDADDVAHAIPSPRAVVELFTSQGCSSCPPADKLLGELSEQPNVIALTMAVDYWDYLGWKDTLAKHGHSLRQKAYARLRGDGKMFTPQAVVNGTAMTIGSDRPALEHVVDSIAAPTVPVSVEARDGGRIHVVVGDGPSTAMPGEVWLCPVASRMTVEIGRGENEGSRITYHNVVRGWTKLGDWDGRKVSFDTTVGAQPGQQADSVAILVQSGSFAEPGKIVGAALQPLH